MISDRMDINQVLAEMRAIKAQTQSPQLQAPGLQEIDKKISAQSLEGMQSPVEEASFGKLFNQAVNKVNDLQATSSAMAKSYEQGQAGINVTDVMIASQKASVSFQAMVQVRNKLVDAYRDVMNMPV